MDPVRYCEDAVLVPGTAHHYAIGPVTQPLRGELCAVFALERDLTKSAYRPTEGSIALTRLAWWHDELDRLARAQPRHPVTRALLPVMPKYGIGVGNLHAVVDALRRDREAMGYATFDMLQRRCLDIECRVIDIVSRICEPAGQWPVEFARDLGTGLALTRLICEFGHDVRIHRIFIPRDELERFAIVLADLPQATALPACLDYQITRAIGYIDKALAVLPHNSKSAQRPVRTLAAISHTTLREMQRHPVEYSRETLVLTPLRMWWIAFCTYHLR